MGATKKEYGELKRFYQYLLEVEMEIEYAEYGRSGQEVWEVSHHPLRALEELEQQSLSKAFRGLKQGILDSLQTASTWNQQELVKANDYLRGRGALAIDTVRKKVGRI